MSSVDDAAVARYPALVVEEDQPFLTRLTPAGRNQKDWGKVKDKARNAKDKVT